LDYLKKQYRPYSTNDIIQNLHGEFSKAVVQKTLEGLGSKELIVTKMFGKVLIVSAAKVEIVCID
jgi:26S proteasome regulatory subunit (ATPase 3-interacting protein)